MKKLSLFVGLLCLGVACSPSTPNVPQNPSQPTASPAANTTATTITVPVEDTGFDTTGLSPMASIKDLDAKIESYELGEGLNPGQLQKNQELKAKIVRGTFDIQELCRLALAKHWDEITVIEQQNVVDLMTKLLEKKALFSKERLSGKDKYYNIQYLSEAIDKDDPKQSIVKTRLVVAKRELKVDIQYKLILTAKGWKIFDVIVDDSSMLLNYRSAFHNIISKYGFKELESRMQKKLDEIK